MILVSYKIVYKEYRRESVKKVKKFIMLASLVLFLTACQQEEDTYVPIKETGKEALEKETVEPQSETPANTQNNENEETETNTTQRVRVTADSLIIRQQMNTNSAIIRTVMNGEEFTVLDTQTGANNTQWYHVRTADGGAEGYVIGDYVQPVEGNTPANNTNSNTNTNQQQTNNN